MDLLISITQKAIRIYIFLIIIRSILSWFSLSYNPFIGFLNRITEPYLSFFRRIIPPFGGLDFSPVLAIAALYFLDNLLLKIFY